jgi:hypothetical protein
MFLSIFFISCKNKNIESIKNNTTEQTIIEEKYILPRKMYIAKQEKVYLWDRYDSYSSYYLVCEIELGKEVEELEQKIIFSIAWSKIKYNDIIGYLPSIFLSENKENCIVEITNPIEGKYYYNCTKYISGSREGEVKKLDINKNNYVQIKMVNSKDLLIMAWIDSLKHTNEYITSIPIMYDVLLNEEYVPMKPVSYGFYFGDNTIVFRQTVHQNDEDLGKEKLSEIVDTEYIK